MSNNQLQTTVTTKVWKAIAKSGIDLSGVDQNNLDKLVQLVVDAALEEVDDQLEQIYKDIAARERAEADKSPAPAPVSSAADDDDEAEVILWEGRPFLSLVVNYVITTERVRIIEGLVGKTYEDIELVRVQDVDFKQTMSERALNLGDISILSHDPSEPSALLRNVKDPQKVHEVLRRAVIKARKKYRLSYREEM